MYDGRQFAVCLVKRLVTCSHSSTTLRHDEHLLGTKTHQTSLHSCALGVSRARRCRLHAIKLCLDIHYLVNFELQHLCALHHISLKVLYLRTQRLHTYIYIQIATIKLRVYDNNTI
jgi:hypothetical protein